jgi:hypothetical protein
LDTCRPTCQQHPQRGRRLPCLAALLLQRSCCLCGLPGYVLPLWRCMHTRSEQSSDQRGDRSRDQDAAIRCMRWGPLVRGVCRVAVARQSPPCCTAVGPGPHAPAVCHNNTPAVVCCHAPAAAELCVEGQRGRMRRGCGPHQVVAGSGGGPRMTGGVCHCGGLQGMWQRPV